MVHLLSTRPSNTGTPKPTGRRGSLLLEMLLGIALLSFFLAAIVVALINSQEQNVASGNRVRGTAIAMRGTEVARLVRDASFSSVPNGTYGVWYNNTTRQWAFSGASVTTSGGYINSVTFSSLASDWKSVTSNVKWRHGGTRSGAVVLQTELTNWRTAGSVGNWGSLTVDGSITQGSDALFTDIVVSGNYVLVAGDDSSGGAGLYVYDISNTASPTRVNTLFNLGHGALALALRGKTLYVLTDDPSNEIKVYSVTGLPSLSYRTSYNLPGSARGTSIANYGAMLYAGTVYGSGGGDKEFFAFDIANSGSIVLKSSFDGNDGYNTIALSGTSAYLATGDDAYELTVMNVENSGSLVYATGQGYNLSGTQNGLAAAISGTSAILGRERGTSIQEFILFKIPNGGVPSTPGPYYHEMSGSVLDLAVDTSGCYAFAATQQKWKALQVININSTSLPEKTSYTLGSGQGRSVFYDMTRDRLFFATDTALYIFRPGASTGSC